MRALLNQGVRLAVNETFAATTAAIAVVIAAIAVAIAAAIEAIAAIADSGTGFSLLCLSLCVCDLPP